MTIDEAITALERDIHNAKICGHQIDQYEIAIDTMHKYQKIEQIYSDYLDDMDAEKLADNLGEVF